MELLIYFSYIFLLIFLVLDWNGLDKQKKSHEEGETISYVCVESNRSFKTQWSKKRCY